MKHEQIISIQKGNIVDLQGNKRIFSGTTVSPRNGGLKPPSIQEADSFFDNLRKNNTSLLRWQILWEDIEGNEPGAYNEAYLADLRTCLKKAETAGILVILDSLMENWGSCLGGCGAPEWTVKIANLEESPDKVQMQKAMFTLFWVGKKLSPQKLVDGDNIQDYLQEHYIAAMKHTARRLKDCKTIIGFGIMAEGQPGDLSSMENLSLNFETDCLKPFQKKFIGAFQKKHSHYLFLTQAMNSGHFSQWKFQENYSIEDEIILKKEGGVIPDADSEASKVITLLSFEQPRKNILGFTSKEKFRQHFQATVKKASGGGNAVMTEITSTKGTECLQELVQEAGLSYFLNKE